MTLLSGSYIYSVDSKGRISLPAKLRKAISPQANETFTITRGFEKCIFVYPQDEWEKFAKAISALSVAHPEHRFFIRTLLEPVAESPLDAQSRITVPKGLLEFASIENEVMILGVFDHIELWNPNEYRAYKASHPKSYEEVAQAIMTNKQM